MNKLIFGDWSGEQKYFCSSKIMFFGKKCLCKYHILLKTEVTIRPVLPNNKSTCEYILGSFYNHHSRKGLSVILPVIRERVVFITFFLPHFIRAESDNIIV